MRKLFAASLFALSLSVPAQAVVREESISYRDGDVVMKGYIAYDDARKDRRPGILVVHEFWGITKHVHDTIRSLAGMGYTALAVDMYGDGKTADDPETARVWSGYVRKNPPVMLSRFNAARAVLVAHSTVDAKRIGAIGFCFGGSVALDMARQGVDLAGVAAFHARLDTSQPAAPGKVKGKVIVMNGADDPIIKPDSVDAFKKEMDAAKVDYRYINYPGAVHSFTNPEATEAGKKYNMPLAYNAEVDRQSKAEMTKFFADLFGTK